MHSVLLIVLDHPVQNADMFVYTPPQIHCQARRNPKTCTASSRLEALFPAGALFRPANSLCSTTSRVKRNSNEGGLGQGGLRLGYCSADGACLEASPYSASAGPGSVLVGLAIFAVCYVILMAAVFYVYCRYCRSRGGANHKYVCVVPGDGSELNSRNGIILYAVWGMSY